MIIFLIILLIIILLRTVYIVPEARAYIIETLGKYTKTWEVGIHFKIPIIQRISNKVDLREQIADFPPQPVITKDNVTMSIDTIVYYNVIDSKQYTYGITDPINAIANLTATTLRNIIGEMDLDKTLTSRDEINSKMRLLLDEATDPWGIKVNRVEIKNLTPPADIQSAMEKQMRAERERRESVIRAEGEKESAILTAEGNKTASVLNAEAEKQAAILRAEAEKEAAILKAEAEKEAAIKVAEGQATAIKTIEQAKAIGYEMLKNSNPTKEVISLRGLEALEKVADGQATKLIIPSELQSIASIASVAKESLENK